MDKMNTVIARLETAEHNLEVAAVEANNAAWPALRDHIVTRRELVSELLAECRASLAWLPKGG